MKKSLLALFLALMLCLSVFLAACEEPDSDPNDPSVGNPSDSNPNTNPNTPTDTVTEEQRKAAVMTYLASLSAGETPTLPEMPNMESALSQLYSALMTFAVSGEYTMTETETGNPTSYTDSVTFQVKDGVIYMDVVDGSVDEMYVFIDESLNTITIEIDKYGNVYTDVKGLNMNEMPTIESLMGMLPIDLTALEFPAITAEDLVVSGTHVSLSPAYIKELAYEGMEASGMFVGMEPAEVEEMVASVNMMINSMKIDIYAIVDANQKIAGYGVTFDAHEAAPLLDLANGCTASIEVLIDPTTGQMTSLEIAFAMAPVTLNAKATFGYAQGALVTCTLDADYTMATEGYYTETVAVDAALGFAEGALVTGTLDADYTVVSDDYAQTMTVDAALDLTDLALDNATILTLEQTNVVTTSESLEPVDNSSYSIEVKKEGAEVTYETKSTSLYSESVTTLTIDFGATPVIPALSADAAAAKTTAETYIANLDAVHAVADKLAELSYAEPNGGYFYYYDATLDASFWVEPEYSETDDETFLYWDINYNFALESEDSVSIVKNGTEYSILPESIYQP